VDVVIATAMIPGRPAPVLLTEQGVRAMAPGSVVVDVAAPSGGNCSLTLPDEVVSVHGVTILGPTNLPAAVPFHASQMYARNVTTFLLSLVREGALAPDESDEIVSATRVTRPEGSVGGNAHTTGGNAQTTRQEVDA
jgi:NAD(P) transhydrogenase subunit alpha